MSKKKSKRTKVYVCSSLRPHVVTRVDKILVGLAAENPRVLFFRPTGNNPDKMMQTVREDVREINKCDELWVIGRYGRDCSWEIGYAMALGKKIRVFTDYTNLERWDSDWMPKIGFDLKLLTVESL